jgi:hypothetical protein
MATINPSVWSAINTAQDLFIIAYPFPQVPAYVSKGPRVPLVYNFIPTNIGSDIEIDKETGNITLAGGITYSISLAADITGVQGCYQLQLQADGEPVGKPAPGGFTLVTTITPAETTVYQLAVFTESGDDWEAPSQVKNTALTIIAVSGYEA